jgi:VWFA-related protein
MLQRRVMPVLLSIGFLTVGMGMCLAQTQAAGQSGAETPAGRTVGAPAGDTPFTLGVTVRRVVLDVVVTDASHNPVHGLSKSEFSVLENNKLQPVQTFEEFNPSAAKPFVAPKAPQLPPNTYVNLQTADERGPLYVIVYDVVHMDQGDQTAARRQLADFLAKKPAGARFALFLLQQNLQLLQGFTADPNLLLQAFDTKRKGASIPLVSLMGMNLGSDNTDLPYVVMSFIGRYLEGLPGRKNLIWLSSRFPENVPLFGLMKQVATAQMGVPGGGGGGAAGGAPVDTGGPSTGSNTATFAGSSPAAAAQSFGDADSTTSSDVFSQKLTREAIDALNEAEVAVYPVDVSGAKPELDGMDDQADHMALVTGGKAYFNSNDFVDAMNQATADGASYYEITYSPTDAQYDARLRKIRVELDKRGYHMEYRRYYFADAPDAPVTREEKKMAEAVEDVHVAHKPGDSMYAYMQHGAPADHDVIFRVQFHAGPKAAASQAQLAVLAQQPAYFVAGKAPKVPKGLAVQTYTIDYLVPERMIGARNGQEQLEFAATAYDGDGKMLNGLSQKASQDAGAAQKPGGSPYFRAQQMLDVPVDAVWIRVAVRDVATDRIGTMEIQLPLAPEPGTAQQTASR